MAIQLSNQRYEEIKCIVVRMFVAYGVSCVPINGFEIAHKMGVKVMPYLPIHQIYAGFLSRKAKTAFP